MIPSSLQTLFWDTNLDTFKPEAYPDYTIFRVLEYGDEEAVKWMRQTFSEAEVRRVLCSEHRLRTPPTLEAKVPFRRSGQLPRSSW